MTQYQKSEVGRAGHTDRSRAGCAVLASASGDKRFAPDTKAKLEAKAVGRKVAGEKGNNEFAIITMKQ